MKKTLKWLLPVMVIALLVGALCIFASAETAEEPTYDYVIMVTPKGSTEGTKYTTNGLMDNFTTLENCTVDIRGDVVWTNNKTPGVLEIKGDVVINLNGYTLDFNYYSSSPSNSYRINTNTGCSLTVNGGTADKHGKMITSATSGQKLYGGLTCTVEFNYVDVTSTVSGSFFDLRNGTYTFNNCNFVNKKDAVFFNTAGSGGSNATLILDGCTYTGISGSAAFVQQGRNNAQNTKAVLEVKNSVLNVPGTAFLLNRRESADVTPTADYSHTASFVNTVINAPNATLLSWKNNNLWTKITIGENTVVNVKQLMQSDANVNSSVSSGDLIKVAYDASVPTDTNFMAVKAADVIDVTFTFGGESLGTRQMGRGVAPVWTAELAKGIYYDTDGVVKKEYTVGWKDGNGNPVTALLADSTEQAITVSEIMESKTAYWAAFSAATPSAETLVKAEFDNNNLRFALTNDCSYVYLYQDMVYAGTDAAMEPISWDCVIDLGGNTLTMSSTASDGADCTFSPVYGSTLTIKNGTAVNTNTRLVYACADSSKGGGKTVLSGLTVKATQTVADIRGVGVEVYDTVIDLQGYVYNVFAIPYVGSAFVDGAIENKFENVKVISSNGEGYAIGVFATGHSTNASTTPEPLKFSFKDVTVDVDLNKATNSNSAVFSAIHPDTTFSFDNVEVNTNYKSRLFRFDNSVVPKITYNDFRISDTLIFEESVLTESVGVFANNGAADKFKFSLTTPENCETQTWSFGGLDYTCYTMAGVTTTLPEVLVWNLDGEDVVAMPKDTSCAAPAVAGNTVSYELTEDKYGLPLYVILDSGKRLVSYHTEITLDFITATPANGIMKLYSDILLNNLAEKPYDTTSIIFANNNVTVDLNGRTFDLKCKKTKNNGWGGYRFSADKTVTFTNGKLTNNSTNMMYVDSNDANVTFNNVDLSVTTSGVALFDARRGKLTLNGGSLINNDRAFSFGYRGGTAHVTLNNTNVNAPYLLNVTSAGDNKNASTTNMTVNGGVINVTDLVRTASQTVNASSKINLTVTGAKLNFTNAVNMPYDAVETVVIDNCWMNKDAVGSVAEGINITYAEGQKVVKTSDATYGYKVMAVTLPVSANLTLYSDFNLNLFLDKSVTAVTANGVALTLEDAGTTWKAVVKSIAAAEAAEGVNFAVSYVEDGVTYTVDYTYSVVKYAQALLGSSYSAESKALVATVVSYVSKAYTYAGNSNDTLAALVEDESYKAILATASNYTKDTIVAGNNYSNLNVAIYSAALTLSNDYKYVVDFVDTYTGTVTVNGVSYTVVDGKVNGKDTVTVTLRGYEFNDGLTVTATTENGTVEGTYTLADYVKAMVSDETENTAFDNLLVALYNFTVEAEEYKAYADANGGNLQ